jgi:esterase/lipase
MARTKTVQVVQLHGPAGTSVSVSKELAEKLKRRGYTTSAPKKAPVRKATSTSGDTSSDES